MTADAINKKLPASLGASDLEHRLGDLFVKVLERHKSREWPMPEAFLAHISSEKPKADEGAAVRGDKAGLSRDELALLENKILPKARRWLGTGLHEHGVKTLEFWGETLEEARRVGL